MNEGNRNIKTILIRLESNSLDERLEALKELSQIDSPDVVEHFIRLLTDTSSEIQIEAADALIKYKDRRSVPQLIETLSDNNKEVKKRVIYVLGELKDRSSVEPLIKLLQDPRGEIRREVIKALGKLGDESAVDPLIEVLSDENKYVRLESAKVLGDLGDERALDPLIDRLDDNSVDVKIQAIISLRNIEDSRSLESILERFSDPNPRVRVEAVKTASKIGDDRAIDSFIDILSDPVYEVKKEAINSLSMINDQRSIDSLVKLLDDTNWHIRVMVLETLEKLGSFELIEDISAKCIKDSNPGVRKAFLEFLVKSADERFVDSSSALIDDENKEVRMLFASYLDSIGAESVIPLLEKLLDDSSIEVQVKAIEALGKIASENCAERLLSIFNTEVEPFVKKAVIDAIDSIGNVNFLSQLKPLLKDEDPTIRESVAKILRKNNMLNYEHFYEAARGYFRDRKFSEAVNCIEKIMDISADDDSVKRMYALSVYGTKEYEKAYVILKELIDSGVRDSDIMSALSDCAKQMGDLEGAVKYLEMENAGVSTDIIRIKELAQLNERLGREKIAYEHYTRLYSLEPGNIAANSFLFWYFIDDNPDEAMNYFKNLAARKHIDENIYLKAAWYFRNNKEYEKGLEICRQLDEAGVVDQSVLFLYIDFFLRSAMPQEAKIYLAKIQPEKLANENIDFTYELVKLLIENNMLEDATGMIEMLKGKVEPACYIEILDRFYDIVSFDKWLSLYTNAKDEYKDSAEYLIFLLKKLLERKDLSLFEENYSQAIQRFHENKALLTLRADYEYSLGNFEEARQLYSQHYDFLNLIQLSRYAQTLFETGNVKDSLGEYTKLSMKTGDNEYEFTIAGLHLRLGEYDNSLRIAEKLLRRYPDSPKAYVLLGNINYKKGLLSEALTSYKRSLDLDKNNHKALIGLANIYIDKKIFEEAYLLINELKEDKEQSKEFDLTLINFYQKQDKWMEAIELVKELEEKYPQDPFVKYHHVICLLNLAKNPQAMEMLESFDIWQLDRDAVFNMAIMLKEFDEKKAASTLLSQLVGRYENKPEYIYNYALVNPDYAMERLPEYLSSGMFRNSIEKLNYAYVSGLIEREKYDEAFIMLEDLLVKYPDNSDFMFELGCLNFRKKDYSKAVRNFDRLILEDDPRPEVFYYLGRIFREKREYDKALAFMLRLFRESSRNIHIEYYVELAKVYEKLKKYELALESIEKALDRRPDEKEYRYFYGTLLIRLSRYQQAEDVFEQLSKDFNMDANIFDKVGLCAKKTGKIAKAIQAYQRCIKLSGDIKYRKNLAMVLLQDKRFEEASELFERLKGNEELRDDKEFIYHQALYEYEMNNTQDSLAYLNRLINVGERSFRVLLLTARNYSKRDQYEKARSYYELIEDKIYEEAELVIEYSTTWERTDNVDKAVFILEKGIELDDKNIYMRLAHLYFSRDMYEESLENISQVLRIEKDNPEALNLKGLIFEKQEEFEKSLKEYEKANNYFKLGSLYTKLHNYEKALRYFDMLVEDDPSDFEAQCFRAIIFKETKEYDKALEILKDLENIYPEKTDSYSLMGTIYELIDDTDKAIENYQKMLEYQDGNIEAYFKLAQLFTRKEDFIQARKNYRSVLELEPENPGAISELASINESEGNYREAEKLLRQLIEIAPDMVEGYKRLAKVYIASEKYNQAVLILNNLEDSQDPEVFLLIARAYHLIDNDTEANVYARKAIGKDGEYFEAYLLLADISFAKERLDDAQYALRRVIELNPLEYMAYLKLAVVYARKGQLEECDRFISEFIEKFPDKIELDETRKIFAEIYRIKGDEEKAVEYYQQINEDEDTNFLYRFGETLYKQGKKEQALEKFKLYVKKDITNLDVIHYMCEIYFEKEKYDSIINLVEFVRKNTKLNWETLLDYGKALYHKKSYDSCIKRLAEAINENPNCGAAYYYTGLAYEARKRFSDSVEYFEKAVLMMSDDPQIHMSLARSYSNTKRYNEAINKLNNLSNNEKVGAQADKMLASIYQDINMAEKAIEAYEKLYDNGVRDYDVLYNLSKLYREKDPEKSLRYMTEINDADTNDKGFYYEVSELLIETKKFEEAQQRLEEFIKDHGDDYKALYLMGTLMMEQELNGDAIDYLKRAISFNPACYQAYKHLAKLVADDKAEKEYLEKYRAYDTDDIDVEYRYLEVLERLSLERDAFELAEKLTKLGPEEFDQYRVLARVFFNSFNMEEALDYATKAAKLNRTPEIISLISEINLKMGDYNECLNALNALNEFSSTDKADINMKLGDCYFKLKNNSEAIKHFKRALQMNAECWDAYSGLARCYELESMYDEALSIVENVLTYKANDPQVLINAARIASKMNDFLGSSQYLSKVLKLEPDNFEASFELANNYFRREMFSESIDILGKMLVKKLPKKLETKVRHLLTDVFITLENYTSAEKEIRKLIQYQPENTKLLMKLGLCLEGSGRTEEALKVYQEISVKDKTEWKSYVSIGDIYFGKGYLDKALAYYRESLKYSKDYTIYYKVGQVFEDKEIYDRAIKYYKECIKVNAEFEKAYFSLSDIYNRQGLTKEAIELYEKLLRINPKSIEGLYRLSRIYSRKKEYDLAMNVLEKLTGIEKENPKVHLDLAKAYHALGKTDEAISEFIRVVNIAPIDSEEAREAQDMLRPDNDKYSEM
ncbi:MAG: hypothetical protein C0601_04555 [Candidatus Muiribacterium halophilum]|uniref:Tetratricopeptide repeat protein 21A/21B fifth ARM repeats domain-containing protein n=1 Tax=Muiribacterium halophilum TaxID=2053465 RepID=A0A2N5ZIJ2_MUIH1|nr:MAG: hypothetical protein C0601_04555 [Candidatus Muirbacterium halophilum]